MRGRRQSINSAATLYGTEGLRGGRAPPLMTRGPSKSERKRPEYVSDLSTDLSTFEFVALTSLSSAALLFNIDRAYFCSDETVFFFEKVGIFLVETYLY